MAITALRFRRSKANNHGGLGLIEIWKAQSCFRPSDPSIIRFSSHVQPPPKRLNMKMLIVHMAGDGFAVIRQLTNKAAFTRELKVTCNPIADPE
jgi:hypothetical protein